MAVDLTEGQEILRSIPRNFLVKEWPKTLVRELGEDDKMYR